MRKLLLPAILIAYVTIAACKKHNDNPRATVSEYTMLAPGNYWIYETFEVDSNGNGAPGSQGGYGTFIDSLYVEKDTSIGSNTYHKFMQPNQAGSHQYVPLYLRDSLDYEVTHYGRVFFAPYDYTSTLYSYSYTYMFIGPDSAFVEEQTTGDKDKSMTVPAGTFTTTAMVTTITIYPLGYNKYYRHMYTRFAAGIGIVSQMLDFRFGWPNYTERRLLRYHVQ